MSNARGGIQNKAEYIEDVYYPDAIQKLAFSDGGRNYGCAVTTIPFPDIRNTYPVTK